MMQKNLAGSSLSKNMNSRGLRLPKLNWEDGAMGVVFEKRDVCELPKIPPVMLPNLGIDFTQRKMKEK